MYRFFQRFTPSFLHKLDHQLLVNRPGLWATRLHYLLFYWLLGAGLASAMLVLMPVNLQDIPKGETPMILLLIVSGIALLAWAIQLAHYQPWKQGESRWRLHAMRDQLVYVLGVGLLLLLPIGFGLLHQLKVASSVSNQVLIQDVRAFAEGQILLENASSDLEDKSYFHHFHLDLDERGWEMKEVREIANCCRQRKREILERYQIVAAKYGPHSLVYELDLDRIVELQEEDHIVENVVHNVRHINNEVRDNLYRLESAKNLFAAGGIRTQGYLMLFSFWASIGLLLILFVRSSWQVFLLSIVSGLALFMVQLMLFGIGSAVGFYPDEGAIAIVLLINWVSLGTMAFVGTSKNTRQQKARMIALNLFAALTTVLPVIFKELFDGGPDREAMLVYVISCTVTFVLWNLFMQGRMLELNIAPKKE
ncbi:MAG: hypothetical protein AAFQ68_19610 [Bacteroidota bacterium]